MPDWRSAPGHTEVEFTALGPGYGECLVVHLGASEWMIVDSCVNEAGEQAALHYLRSLGVDVATAVKLVVATHWHDDHVRGMSALVDECRSAKFSCSVALSGRELLNGIGRQPETGRPGSSGVKEMRAVLGTVTARNRTRSPSPMWAMERSSLYHRDGPGGCEVSALSPSDQMVGAAMMSIRGLVERGRTGKVPSPNVNHAAVVLWVEVGDATMLLGSDLQEKPRRGWTAAIECRTGRQEKAEIFKVPHHGSENAHLDAVWRTLLHERPHAVVCSFNNGSVDLPTSADVTRLCRLANLHRTTPDGSRTLLQEGRPMRSIGPMGRVTLRRPVGTGNRWEVHYDGGCPGCAPTDRTFDASTRVVDSPFSEEGDEVQDGLRELAGERALRAGVEGVDEDPAAH